MRTEHYHRAAQDGSWRYLKGLLHDGRHGYGRWRKSLAEIVSKAMHRAGGPDKSLEALRETAKGLSALERTSPENSELHKCRMRCADLIAALECAATRRLEVLV